MLTEVNIDALVGPSHHYGGLGVGNVASIEHKHQVSSPKKAVLEGLAKAAKVAALGVPQFVWLPPPRPRLAMLDALGFQGTLSEKLRAASELAPNILSAAYSSAFMWAANAATVSPAVDASDGRYHITPANLISSWHRGGEAQERLLSLKQLLAGIDCVDIHSPLPSIVPVRDEGAANHMRLCDPTADIGLNVFVYGDNEQASAGDAGFFPRQTRAAFEAIARQHRLRPDATFFLKQHPAAISAGVFHNDVIATSHQGLLIHHEFAFEDAEAELARIESQFESATGVPLLRISVASSDMTLEDAVRSYFFNSQILSVSEAGESGRMQLICPQQCSEIETVQRFITKLIDDASVPIDRVHFVSLAESMAGGGGPACLRLRLPLDAEFLAQMNPALRLTDALVERLTRVIERVYPDQIEPAYLAQADFAELCLHASAELHAAIA